MRKYIIIHILLLILLSYSAKSQSYTLNGDASSLGGDCYQLTPDVADQYGTVWYSDQLDLSQAFDISFRAYLGTVDATGADGMVFVLQNVGNNALGTSGDGMGYAGFSPSLGIEFDTYDNGSWSGVTSEIGPDHIAISKNGDILNPIAGPIQANSTLTNIEYDYEHPVRITWNPTTQLIEVYFDCELRLSTNYDIIGNIFGGNPIVYWGFTAATGGYHNEQHVCVETNVITVPDTVYVCEGSTVTLDATGSSNNSYSWTPNYNISGANTQQPSVWPTQDTTYYVTYTDYCGFNRQDSIRVIVNPLPQPNLGNDTVLCPGNNLIIDAGTFDGYSWSGGESTQTITVNSAATYTVSVTDANSCVGIDDIIVTMGTLPDIDAGNNTQICVGGSVNLTATSTNGTNYEWNTGETTQSITVSPASTTIYSVTVTDANLCESADHVTVDVATSLTVNLGNDTAICAGESLDVIANGGISYTWSTGESSQTINVNTSGNYSVTVSDGATCTGTDDINVTINPLPNISAGADENICIGDNINLTATGGTVYSWNTGENTQSINVSPTTQTQYTVIGADLNGCMNTDDVVVNVNPLPNVDLGPDLTVCENNSVNITSNVVGTYLWTGGANTQTITVTPTANQNIGVTVTDNNGCVGTDDININVTTGINVTITPDLSACPNELVTLTASGGTNYNWSTNENTASINVNTPLTPTYYSVTVGDGSSCFGYDSVLVTPYSLPNADAGPNHEVCDGESVTLTASGGNSYLWSTGESSISITVNPTTTTQYTVTVTDANSCENTDNVTVNVHPPLQLDVQHTPQTVCPGESVLLTTNITGGGSPPYMITLDDGTVISPPLTIIPTDTTYITINVSSSLCPGLVTETEMIPVFYVPEPNFTSSVTSGCEPLMVSFNSLNDEPGLQYHWNFGNYGSNFSNEKDPYQVYVGEGTYDVSLQLTTEQGCTKSTTVNQMITVYPKPHAKFIAEPLVISSVNPEVQFTDLSYGAYNNIWYFGDGDTSSFISPFHKYNIDEAGEYRVTMIAETEYGCTDTTRNTIKVQDITTFYVPTAFSPDGDGINDVFNVQAYGVDLDSYTMWIYDRWGEIIYKTSDIYNGWDGTVKDNKIAEAGVYTWRVVYKEISGIEYSKAGVVTVIR